MRTTVKPGKTNTNIFSLKNKDAQSGVLAYVFHKHMGGRGRQVSEFRLGGQPGMESGIHCVCGGGGEKKASAYIFG